MKGAKRVGVGKSGKKTPPQHHGKYGGEKKGEKLTVVKCGAVRQAADNFPCEGELNGRLRRRTGLPDSLSKADICSPCKYIVVHEVKLCQENKSPLCHQILIFAEVLFLGLIFFDKPDILLLGTVVDSLSATTASKVCGAVLFFSMQKNIGNFRRIFILHQYTDSIVIQQQSCRGVRQLF